MKSFAAATLITAAAADSIALSISDCGSGVPGHVQDINPKSITTGQKTHVVGSGTLDSDVSGGDFTLDVKALGVSLQSCNGDICSASTCNLPLNTGSIAFAGMACPVKAGSVEIPMDVTVAATIPSQLAVLEITLDVKGALCAKINTKAGLSSADTCSIYDTWDADNCGEVQLDCSFVAPAKAFRSTLKDGHCADIGYTVSEGTQTINVPQAGDVTISWFKQAVAVEARGACSADDQAALSDAQTVGERQNACGTKALGLSGIDHDKFTSCVQSDLGISAGCSECYYTVAQYGFDNCKAACLLGWCKAGCLSCTQSAQDGLPACTGFQPSVASPCDSEVSV